MKSSERNSLVSRLEALKKSSDFHKRSLMELSDFTGYEDMNKPAQMQARIKYTRASMLAQARILQSQEIFADVLKALLEK